MAEQDFITIQAQATQRDPRSKHYVVGMAHHNRQMETFGAIAMALKGKQSAEKAWVQAALLII